MSLTFSNQNADNRFLKFGSISNPIPNRKLYLILFEYHFECISIHKTNFSKGLISTPPKNPLSINSKTIKPSHHLPKPIRPTNSINSIKFFLILSNPILQTKFNTAVPDSANLWRRDFLLHLCLKTLLNSLNKNCMGN